MSILAPTNLKGGSWKINGWALPDLGITENVQRAASLFTPTKSSNFAQGGGSNLSDMFSPTPMASNNQGQIQGASTTGAWQNSSQLPAGQSLSGSTGLSGSNSGGNGGNNNNNGLVNDYNKLAGQNYQDTVQSQNSLSDAEISALNDQLGQAGLSKSNMLQTVDDQQKQIDAQKASQIQDANDRTVEEIAAGSSTARASQLKIRNMLRGLGILASSAAAELLSQPINEFSTQKAQINQALTKRLGEIDTWYNGQLSTLAAAKRDIEFQYSSMVDKIKSDIRFTESERASSLAQARNSLQEKMLEIRASLSNVQQGVTSSLSDLGSFVGQINDGSINDTYNNALSGVTQGQNQSGDYYGDPTKKKQNDYSGDGFLGLSQS